MPGGFEVTVLLVAVRDSLLVVSDADGRWVAEQRFVGKSRVTCLTTDPRRAERVYCGTASDGLWRSEDLGRNWSRVGEGAMHEHVTAVAVSSTEHGADGSAVLYAGSEPTALYRSEDAGETWEPMPPLGEG